MTHTTKTDLEQCAAAWAEWLRLSGRSPKTITTYVAALLNLHRFLHLRRITDVRQIKQGDLKAWQQALVQNECTLATREQFTRTARYWFDWLRKRGLIFVDPTVALQKFKLPRTQGRCPSEVQMAELLRYTVGHTPLAQRDRALLEIAYATGARREEMMRLRVESLDLEQGLVRLHGKGNRERVVPLTGLAVKACARYLAVGRGKLLAGKSDHGALFLSTRGGSALGYAGIAAVIAAAGRRAGIKITNQEIRRAFATHLHHGGAHVTSIKELLGHSSYRHLRHYLILPADRSELVKKLNPTK